jgi:putative tricarboxylic transport membrane protein
MLSVFLLKCVLKIGGTKITVAQDTKEETHLVSTIELLHEGLVGLFTMQNMLILLAGSCIGIVCGSIPGLSASNTTAIMLPVTLNFDLAGALIFIGAIYMCANYGGSIPRFC